MMVGKNLKDSQIQQIANRTILYLDKVIWEKYPGGGGIK